MSTEKPLNQVSIKQTEFVRDDYAEIAQEEFLTFLKTYSEPAAAGQDEEMDDASILPSETSSIRLTSQANNEHSQRTKALYYVVQLGEMKHQQSQTLYVNFAHILQSNETLAKAIVQYFYRFENVLKRAVFLFVRANFPEYAIVPSTQVPKDFSVSIFNLGSQYRIRDLNTRKIGMLIKMSGTVTRTSEIRPELVLGTFQCLQCMSLYPNVEQQFKYTEPVICANPICQNKRNWKLVVERSTFVNWQKIHVQENSNEIPPGSMPRGMDIIVRNDMVEKAKPGDKCDFTGCLIVVPDVAQMALPGGKLENSRDGGRNKQGFEGITGLKSLGVRELSYRLSFVACMVQPSDAKMNLFKDTEMDENNVTELFTPREREEILRIRETPQLYQRMIESMAPTIFGHQDVKAGIALMLFGGVHKSTAEGMKLRGDINVCIVGDPGTAKSQFLKYVTGFLPRSVYTSGKASSAAGLTASVVKDEETGEFTIEAGALMLADNGICAIDEFDKMDISDQVAIHEAMEQQTISIAKAGIQATLNARTSILAAANPVHGRYDRKRSLRQNINMSAPIMSRFDLFFVILDDCDEEHDASIAQHIVNLHRYRDHAIEPPFNADQLKRYIRFARTIRPQMNVESAKLLSERYKQLRQNDATGYGASYRMTVRQLESMIRLSEALARLHCDPEVKVKYVKEACRLLKNSIIRVENEEIEMDDEPVMMEETVEPPKMRLKYEEYMRISNMIIHHLRNLERSEQVLKKQHLIEWFLDNEDDIETIEEMELRTKQIKGVIERLIHKDHVLLEMGEDGTQDKIVVVHPNYVPAE